MQYHPDKWLLIELNDGGEKSYKVFASFFGGFAGSNSWKLNSGITKVETEGDLFHFYGHSGSVYVCHRETYGAHMYGHGIVKGWESEFPGEIKALSEDEALVLLNNWE